MRIATWNVNSLKARLEKLAWWLERARPDVVLLQETKSTDAEAPTLALREHGYLTGETWRDVDDPSHYVVLSTWRTRADWDEWAASDARRRVLDRLAPLVLSERITCFEPA